MPLTVHLHSKISTYDRFEKRTTDRKGFSKYTEKMSNLQHRRLIGCIVLLSIITFGGYLVYLNRSKEGHIDLKNLKERKFVHYVAEIIDTNSKNKQPPKTSITKSNEFKKLENSVKSLDSDKFSTLFNVLKKEGKHKLAADFAVALLKNESPLLDSNKKRYHYEFILRNLKAVYPEITTFFSKKYRGEVEVTESDVSGEGVDHIIMNPNGIRIVLDDLNRKGSLKDLDIIIYDYIDELVANLKNVLLQMANKPGRQKQGMLVRQRYKGKQQYNHITPIVIEKTNEGKFRILVTDSVAKKTSALKLIKIVENSFKSTSLQNDIALYVHLGQKRQNDGANCPIFSMRDLVHTSQHFDEVMDWAEHRSTKMEETQFAYSFNYLPPGMMKIAQSMSLVKEYLSTHKDQSKKSICTRTKKKGQTLKEALAKHTRSSLMGLKERNVKVTGLFLKYERMIIHNVICGDYTSK